MCHLVSTTYLIFNNFFAQHKEYKDALHYSDAIMGTMASQIISLTIVYSTVYSSVDHRKHRSSASLAFVRGIHRCPVNSPHKWPVTRKMLPYDNVIMDMAHGKCMDLPWSLKPETGCYIVGAILS